MPIEIGFIDRKASGRGRVENKLACFLKEVVGLFKTLAPGI